MIIGKITEVSDELFQAFSRSRKPVSSSLSSSFPYGRRGKGAEFDVTEDSLAEKIAELRGTTTEHIVEITYQNTLDLFHAKILHARCRLVWAISALDSFIIESFIALWIAISFFN